MPAITTLDTTSGPQRNRKVRFRLNRGNIRKAKLTLASRFESVMKYCPVCSARYDEEVIRFCTKDGTPLLDENQPNFTAIPSETIIEDADDEIGQETVIRRKPLVPPDQPLSFDTEGRSERIVIPTSEPQPGPNVRARTAQGYVVPPPPPNTAKTVLLTILGTLGIVGLGVLLFWMLRSDPPANANVNVNANQNANLNTNLSFDSNFNFNVNANANSNLNTNFNISANLPTNTNSNANTRPSPSPSPRLSPSPSPVVTTSPTPSNTSTPRPANTRPANVPPTPLGTPRIGPRPPPLANRPGNANQ